MCVCTNTCVKIEETEFIQRGKLFKCPVEIERCLECGEEIANAKYALQNLIAMLETSR